MRCHHHITVILCFCYAVITAQVSDCPYNKTITGNLPAGNHQAESKITSRANHVIGSNVTYTAREVEIQSNFNIDSTSSLEVSTDGCVATCLPDQNPCEHDCPSAFDTQQNERGIRYVANEVVITFPDDATVFYDNQDYVLIVNGTQFIMTNILSEFIKGVPQQGTLTRCLCDDNIFFYRNEGMIFEEGGIKRTNSAAGGVKEEGGTFSLNYIIDYAEPSFNSDRLSPSTNYRISDRANVDGNGNETIVAILDSGIYPEVIPDNTMYYDEDEATFICGLEDPAGYNFVDNNTNLLDLRGHGTLVSLSYIYAYVRMVDPAQIINQKLLTVKVLNDCGEGTLFSALCGLKYAAAKGADIINCSWGLYQPDINLQRVIKEISTETDVRIVCSAGNAGKPLELDTHFPSGFAREYISLSVEEDKKASALPYVYEVTGSCKYFYDSCGNIRENLPLSASSNYAELNFAEASKGVELLLPAAYRPKCQIQGTSYAAPVLTAGLAFLQVTGAPTLTNKELLEYCKKIHPDQDNYSFFSNNCWP